MQLSTIPEEQDFAFAMGLYRDSVYQMAAEQFEEFARKYPASPRSVEAIFLQVECLYAEGQFSAALDGYSGFLAKFPESKFVPEARLRKGQALLQLKRPAEAVTVFRTVLEKHNDLPVAGEAAYWLGESYLKSGDDENAIKYYQLSAEGYPNSPVADYALYSVGWTYQRKGDYRKAAEAFARMAKSAPNSPFGSEAMVRALESTFLLKDYAGVLSQAEKLRPGLASVDHRARVDFYTAESEFQLGNLPAARAGYTSFLKSYPDHPLVRDAQYGIGWTMLKQREFLLAAEQFGRVASGSDVLACAALFREGVALGLAGQKDSAASSYAECVRRFPQGEYSDNALYEHASLLFESKRWPESRSLLERLTKEYPQSDVKADASRLIGECLLAEGKLAEAAEAFSAAAAASDAPSASRNLALYQAAWTNFKQKKYPEATEQFGKFLKDDPANSRAHLAHFWKAEAEYAQGRFADARISYVAASKDSAGEKQEDALYGAGWSAFKLDRFDDAILSFERLLAGYPKGARAFDARLRLGDCYFSKKEYKKAGASYRIVMRLFPDHEGRDYAYYQAGQSSQKDGDNAEAYKAFEGLVKLMPRSPLADDAQYALGWINFQRKDFNEAVKEFQNVVKNYPDGDVAPRAFYSMADSYYNLQQYEPAEKAYRELLRRYPESPYVADATNGIQYCLVALGRDQEAMQVMDEFIRDHPKSPVSEDLALKKGEMLLNKKKYAEAAAEYRSFQTRFPGSRQSAVALFWLGETYRIQGNLTEAAETYEKAAASPTAGGTMASRSLLEAARIYVDANNSSKAIVVLNQVIKRKDPPASAADAMLLKGVLFDRVGNRAEASSQYEAVIREYPAFDAADDARIRMARLEAQAGQHAAARALAGRVATNRKDALGAEAQTFVGETFALQSDWQNAVKAYLRVRYVFPSQSDWIARASLGAGIAYERTGDAKRAAEQYALAKRISKEPAVQKEADQRLKGLDRK